MWLESSSVMTAPLYPELEHVCSPKCAHSRSKTVRKKIRKLKKRKTQLTRHTEEPAGPASEGARRRGRAECLVCPLYQADGHEEGQVSEVLRSMASHVDVILTPSDRQGCKSPQVWGLKPCCRQGSCNTMQGRLYSLE